MRGLSIIINKEDPGAISLAAGAEGVSDMDSRNNETSIAFVRAAQP